MKLCTNNVEHTVGSIEEARELLLMNICDGCLNGNVDEGCEDAPDQSNIEDLLSTACGVQYWVED